MPEVVRGSRPSVDVRIPSGQGRSSAEIPESPAARGRVHFDDNEPAPPLSPSTENPLNLTESSRSRSRRKSSTWRREQGEGGEHAERDAYYDSRAATKREFRRRASTLQEYYKENPELLPQLPFTWHHGWRRYKFFGLVFVMFVDACVLPIALYYGMSYGGDIEGWISKMTKTTEQCPIS